MEMIRARAYCIAAYKTSFIYRSNVWLQILGVIILIAIQFFLWTSTMQEENTTIIYSILIYTIFSRIFVFILPGARTIKFISDKILTGKIIMELIKPIRLSVITFFNELGFLIFNFLFLVLPSMVIIFLIFDISILNLHFLNLEFVISFFFSFILSFLISYCIGTLSIWIGNIWGVNELYNALMIVFGGSLLPLSLYPEFLKNIALFLPFQCIYFTPLAYFSGITSISGNPILIQFMWILIFLLIMNFLTKMVNRKVAYMGG